MSTTVAVQNRIFDQNWLCPLHMESQCNAQLINRYTCSSTIRFNSFVSPFYNFFFIRNSNNDTKMNAWKNLPQNQHKSNTADLFLLFLFAVYFLLIIIILQHLHNVQFVLTHKCCYSAKRKIRKRLDWCFHFWWINWN